MTNTLISIQNFKTLFAITLIALGLPVVFQNCDGGTIVGNPARFTTARLSFSGFNAKVTNVEVCLTNIRFRISNLEEAANFDLNAIALPTNPTQGGFDVSYMYYEPESQRYYINGLFVNRVLPLDSGGTLIGDFNLPEGLYDQVHFGFSKCETTSATTHPSLSFVNDGTPVADSKKFFVLPYSEVRDLHAQENNIFNIESFMTGLNTVSNSAQLNTVLDPLRTFDLIGLSNLRISQLPQMRFDQIVKHKTGSVAVGFSPAGNGQVWIARFTAEGLLDETFAPTSPVPGIRILTNIKIDAKTHFAITTDPSDNIYIAGSTTIDPINAMDYVYHYGFVFKLDPLGQPVTTFQRQGWGIYMAVVGGGGYCIDSNNFTFVLNGHSLYYNTTNNALYVMIASATCSTLMVKINPSNGAVDTNFGTNRAIPGMEVIKFSGEVFKNKIHMIAAANGKLLVAATANNNWMVMRINAATGALDTTFNGGLGYYQFANLMPTAMTQNIVGGLAVDNSGRIIVAGSLDTGNNQTNYDFGAVRLLSDGAVDSSFGLSGIVRYDFSYGSDHVENILFDSVKQRLILSGTMRGIEHNHYGLLALHSDSGAPDQSVSPRGARVFFANLDAAGGSLAVKSDGSYALGGARNDSLHLLSLAK